MGTQKFIFYFLFLTSFFSIEKLSSQVDKPSPEELFAAKNYIQALDEFLKFEKEFPDDPELKHNIGTCYLNIYTDKSLAIPYLEFALKNPLYKNNELLLDLAKAYQYAYRFEDAKKYYNLYKEKCSSKVIDLINHYIETCDNAEVLIKKPVNVTFKGLGKEINTKFADYYPFVTEDEETMFFTSRREQNTGRLRSYNGYYTSDIYTSNVVSGEWTKAKNMGAIVNTSEDEECVGISPEGKDMILFVDRDNFPGDLFHTEIRKTKNFVRPVPFNEPVNTDFLELEGCYGKDANTLFFVSDRKGGIGDADILFCHRLPNGEWGVPKNLGPNINTKYKEAFPQVTDDGKTLFFSSQGHSSMGGFDIFKSTWNEKTKTWNKPVNIGYPINTPDDDMMFSVCANGRDGYISAWRKEGMGDLDIYKIIFNEIEEELSAIVGNVSLADTNKTEVIAHIKIKELKTGTELDAKNVNKKSGRYIFIVPPGKYQIEIISPGNKTITENMTVFAKSDFKPEIIKNFVLYDINYIPPAPKDPKAKPKPKAGTSVARPRPTAAPVKKK
jgi:hypothetical protein